MDECTLWEIDDIIEYLHYTDTNSWEQTRTLAYITALTQSTKKLKPEDILKLPWDEDEAERKKNINVSNEDKQRLMFMSNFMR